MRQTPEGLERKLDDLRRSFDESFASPRQTQTVEQEDMLAIQIQGGRFAVRVAELAGVHAARKIVPLPGALPGLLGVVGIRGRLVVAYRLSDLVGATPSSTEARLRWLLVCRDDSQVSLAVEGLEAYIRVDKTSIHPVRDEEGIGEHVREVLSHNGAIRGVLHVQSIIEAIARRAKAIPQRKEP